MEKTKIVDGNNSKNLNQNAKFANILGDDFFQILQKEEWNENQHRKQNKNPLIPKKTDSVSNHLSQKVSQKTESNSVQKVSQKTGLVSNHLPKKASDNKITRNTSDSHHKSQVIYQTHDKRDVTEQKNNNIQADISHDDKFKETLVSNIDNTIDKTDESKEVIVNFSDAYFFQHALSNDIHDLAIENNCLLQENARLDISSMLNEIEISIEQKNIFIDKDMDIEIVLISDSEMMKKTQNAKNDFTDNNVDSSSTIINKPIINNLSFDATSDDLNFNDQNKSSTEEYSVYDIADEHGILARSEIVVTKSFDGTLEVRTPLVHATKITQSVIEIIRKTFVHLDSNKLVIYMQPESLGKITVEVEFNKAHTVCKLHFTASEFETLAKLREDQDLLLRSLHKVVSMENTENSLTFNLQSDDSQEQYRRHHENHEKQKNKIVLDKNRVQIYDSILPIL